MPLLAASLGHHSTYNCNDDGEGRTVSIHLYTPPYIECRFDEGSPTDNEMSYIPVVHCPQAKVRRSASGEETPAR